MNKVIIPILAVLIIVAAVLAARIKGTDTTSAPHESLNPGGGLSYTLADVAKHADRASCWTAINGNVYDLTTAIDKHPGGPEAILSICGKDGSAAFNDQHGGQRRPAEELAKYLIGSLSQ